MSPTFGGHLKEVGFTWTSFAWSFYALSRPSIGGLWIPPLVGRAPPFVRTGRQPGGCPAGALGLSESLGGGDVDSACCGWPPTNMTSKQDQRLYAPVCSLSRRSRLPGRYWLCVEIGEAQQPQLSFKATPKRVPFKQTLPFVRPWLFAGASGCPLPEVRGGIRSTAKPVPRPKSSHCRSWPSPGLAHPCGLVFWRVPSGWFEGNQRENHNFAAVSPF